MSGPRLFEPIWLPVSAKLQPRKNILRKGDYRGSRDGAEWEGE
jgi:hypothetical protein